MKNYNDKPNNRPNKRPYQKQQDTRWYKTPSGEFNYTETTKVVKKNFKVELVLTEDATTLQLPEKKTSGSAAYDVKALFDGKIEPGQMINKVRTGIKVKIPYGTAGFLSVRSSIGNEGIMLCNAPGLIDSDYRGEITGTIVNISSKPFEWKAGDRLFQLTFLPIRIGDLVNVPEFSPDNFENTRGEGGYGSTGR